MIGIVHTTDTSGCWLIGAGGGIFASGDAGLVSVVKVVWAKARPKKRLGRGGTASGPSDQRPRLCRTDYEIVKVPAHL